MPENRKPAIVLVDDEPMILTSIRTLLTLEIECETESFTSPFEAVKFLEKNIVDLTISDYLMPGTTGTELAQQVKTRYPELPVVLISGVNEIPSGAEVADAFLSKIEGPEKLCEQIAAVLSERT